MATDETDGKKVIARRHCEWHEFQAYWRWLADSLEGGERYRNADYSLDPIQHKQPTTPFWYSQLVSQGAHNGNTVTIFAKASRRNLIPHLGELEPEGAATYALRLSRTPIPKLVERTVRRHLSRIFAGEVRRNIPANVEEWADNVDGAGTDLDCWMRKTVAPLLLTLGQLDLCFDHPQVEDGEDAPQTEADVRAAGLDRCVASIILPENVVWWKLNSRRHYEEVLIVERDDDGEPSYRHWTKTGWTLYDCKGKTVGTGVHNFGCVPIVRVFDDRKPRCRNVGQSRYESIAELQKAIYNTRSELVLGDVLQSNPLLQGPEDYVQGDSKVSVGPDRILPMRPNADHSAYTEWKYLEPPKAASQDIRQRTLDYSDEADREAALTKPAGANGQGTVGQSGISKAFDNQEGSDYLSEVAATLAEAEECACRMALRVLLDREPTPEEYEAIEIEYPTEFGLLSADELATAITDLQSIMSSAGDMPITEEELLFRFISSVLAGAGDDKLTEIRKEVEDVLKRKAEQRDMQAEAIANGMQNDNGMTNDGVDANAGDPAASDMINAE